MRAVRGRGNESTELVLARLLRASGMTGWRRHVELPGRPDFSWREARLAVFVDGCFWHGCPRCYRPPRKNASFWREKLAANRARDRKNSRLLRAAGWRVMRVWECRVKAADTIRRIGGALHRSPRPGHLLPGQRGAR